MPEFVRAPNEEEKRQFVPLLGVPGRTVKEIFEEQLVEKQQEFVIKQKPFCATCARYDFQDWASKYIRESERSRGYADFEKLKNLLPNLEEYGSETRFFKPGDIVPYPNRKNPNAKKTLKEVDAMEPIGKADFAKGEIQRQIKIGVHKEYKCKNRGCNIAIFFSNKDMEEKVSKK